MGFVFAFALVTASVGVVYTTGIGGLEDARENEQVTNAVRAFDVLHDNIEDVTREDAPSRATEKRRTRNSKPSRPVSNGPRTDCRKPVRTFPMSCPEPPSNDWTRHSVARTRRAIPRSSDSGGLDRRQLAPRQIQPNPEDDCVDRDSDPEEQAEYHRKQEAEPERGQTRGERGGPSYTAQRRVPRCATSPAWIPGPSSST